MRVMVSDNDENMNVDKTHEDKWGEEAAAEECAVGALLEKIIVDTSRTLESFSCHARVVNENHSDGTNPRKDDYRPGRPPCHGRGIVEWSHYTNPVIHCECQEMCDGDEDSALSANAVE